VRYNVYSEWNSGYVIGIDLLNKSGSPVNNWQISWPIAYGETFANYWNGNCRISSGWITCTNMSYNAAIGPNGGSINLGAQLNSPTGRASRPVTFIVNGQTITR
jgi:hypothetical protein